jgi:hypothetical protein
MSGPNKLECLWLRFGVFAWSLSERGFTIVGFDYYYSLDWKFLHQRQAL